VEIQPLKHRSVTAVPDWFLRALIVAALVVTAMLTMRVSYPPFQDFPNQLHVLTLDRAIDIPEISHYFQRPEHFVYGYSLCSLLNRASSGWISESTALRLMFVLAALGFPLGVAWVARAVGGNTLWACLLALPLALSWPVKMGFVQFSLGLAAALFGIAAAIRAARDPRLIRGLELACWISLTYMAHALALGLLMIGMGLAWLDASRSKSRVAAIFGLALLPTGILVSADLVHDVFRAIPQTAVSLQQHPLTFRSPGPALANLFTRSYGISNAGALLWYGPLLVLLVLAAAVAFRRHPELRRTNASYLLWAVPFMILACVGSPETTERIYFIGSRLAALAMGLVTVVAAATVARATLTTQLIAVGTTVLALVGVLGETASRSGSLSKLLGPEGPERVSGRYLTAKVGPCADSDEEYWGRYESERHLWAYALARDGITPYLFAWSQYHPVQYRGEIYRQHLRAPRESINGDRLLGGSCAAANQERLRGATSWVEFDGALITGRPESLSDLAGHPNLQGARHLAPGLLLTQPPSGRSTELHVDMNHFQSAQYLGRGWNDSEYSGDRQVRWSDGSTSEIAFELETTPGPYELRLTMLPYAATMPQSIDVTLNKEPLGQLTPQGGWGQSYLIVPPQRLRNGPNLLTLGYQRVARPRAVDGSPDDRELAIMFDEIDLIPLSEGLSFEMDPSDSSWSFLRGWSGLERLDGRTVRWSEGPTSALGFRLSPKPGQYRLTFSALPYQPTMPQSLTVSLNGTVLETLAIDKGWQEYSLTIPEGLAQVEENELSLEYASTKRPHDISESSDTRRLALLFDAIRLFPVGSRPPIPD